MGKLFLREFCFIIVIIKLSFKFQTNVDKNKKYIKGDGSQENDTIFFREVHLLLLT